MIFSDLDFLKVADHWQEEGNCVAISHTSRFPQFVLSRFLWCKLKTWRTSGAWLGFLFFVALLQFYPNTSFGDISFTLNVCVLWQQDAGVHEGCLCVCVSLCVHLILVPQCDYERKQTHGLLHLERVLPLPPEPQLWLYWEAEISIRLGKNYTLNTNGCKKPSGCFL